MHVLLSWLRNCGRSSPVYRNQTAEGMLSYCQCCHTAGQNTALLKLFNTMCVCVCLCVLKLFNTVCVCVCLRGCLLMVLLSASDMEINESILCVVPSVSFVYSCLNVLLLLIFHPSPFPSFPLARHSFSVAYSSV